MRYVPGALGGACLVGGVFLAWGIAFALLAAGALLLVLDGRVRT
jgi:hypothetical protein